MVVFLRGWFFESEERERTVRLRMIGESGVYAVSEIDRGNRVEV